MGVQPLVALAKSDEVGLHSIGNAEIEVPPVRILQEAGRTEVLVVAEPIDIGPELARAIRDAALARQISPALGERRRKAEVETEQCGLLRGAFEKPVEHLGP